MPKDIYTADERAFLRVIGECIRSRRLNANISQDMLAAQAKIHRTYLGDIEKGRRSFTLKVMHRLAQALKTSPSKLFTKAEYLQKNSKLP